MQREWCTWVSIGHLTVLWRSRSFPILCRRRNGAFTVPNSGARRCRVDDAQVVVIHDFVDRDGHLALVMEHLFNDTVWDRSLHHGLTAPRSCGLVLAVFPGVVHVDDRGVMHRDIEPENLIFTHDWQRKVTDVDIAQVLIIAETMAAFGGASVETPAYM